MSEYSNLCQLYFAREPHFKTIDQILRQLPQKIQNAIITYLQPPDGHASLPSDIFGRPVPYVGLYKERFDHGQKHREPCVSDCLIRDFDGAYSFIIGLCVEAAPGAFQSSILYFKFSVEKVSENFVTIQVVGLGGSIEITVSDPNSYDAAAQEFLRRYAHYLEEPQRAGSAIGFGAI